MGGKKWTKFSATSKSPCASHRLPCSPRRRSASLCSDFPTRPKSPNSTTTCARGQPRSLQAGSVAWPSLRTSRLNLAKRPLLQRRVAARKKRSKKAASSKPAPLSRASSTASTGSASAALSPRSAAPGALPPPGSTDDERLAFFAKKFEFWNRDLDTETMRVKRRVVIFKKLALLRERLRPLLGGADVSDHDFFLKFVHAAENIEGALFRIYSKKPKTLLETMRNLVFGLGKKPNPSGKRHAWEHPGGQARKNVT
eukprot:INCI5866.4.p1 GENE.INCI5866.4~~INCI5866.4.p1  ORF type:complete len:255 (+),score=31.58 INCI5866.4:208-972(+)